MYLTRYCDIRPSLQTGDLVLSEGTGIFSAAIRHVTGCHWSHVGLVIRVQELDQIALFESVLHPAFPDEQHGDLRSGVHQVALSRVIRCANGAVAIRRLRQPLSKDAIRRLSDFRKEVDGRPYERSLKQLLGAALDSRWGVDNAADLSSVFCSELVAAAYIAVGLLAPDRPASEYTPADFSGDSQKPLKMLANGLGHEIRITAY